MYLYSLLDRNRAIDWEKADSLNEALDRFVNRENRNCTWKVLHEFHHMAVVQFGTTVYGVKWRKV